MADTYSFISVITFVLAGVFFILSCILFFVLDIRKVVGDLSGRNARKSIEEMKKKQEREEIKSPVLNFPLRENTEKITEALSPEALKAHKSVENGTVILSEEQLLPSRDKFILEKEIIFVHVEDISAIS